LFSAYAPNRGRLGRWSITLAEYPVASAEAPSLWSANDDLHGDGPSCPATDADLCVGYRGRRDRDKDHGAGTGFLTVGRRALSPWLESSRATSSSTSALEMAR
jgi:hypothetical protein